MAMSGDAESAWAAAMEAGGVNWDALVAAAADARTRAYAPYSGFRVGAVVVAEGGARYQGANVENASYGLCLCAERVAMATALAAGHRRFLALAVIADTPGPVSPCGACRQFMAEFGLDWPVMLANVAGDRTLTTTGALLPGAFTPGVLGVGADGTRTATVGDAPSSAATAGAPVGLETTILAFGLPAPINRETADACEAAVRDAGATPVTLAILRGEARYGLTPDEIAFFCSGDPAIRKVNLQNMAACLAEGAPGALTVAASVALCAARGIGVFATGGIGGVHRGWAAGGAPGAMDISGDLAALARFPVTVVCAGAKGVLDTAATLEALETLGVPVVGFGARTFPLFHVRESDHPLETWYGDDESGIEALARFVAAHRKVSGTGVMVVAPVPAEHALPAADVDGWIGAALAEAAAAGIVGKAVTPYLLSRLKDLSGGRTLSANRALVVNNAGIAGRLAAALASGRLGDRHGRDFATTGGGA